MKPAAVFVETQFRPGKSSYENPEKALHFGMYPTVFLTQNELKKSHDFRFLANCQVHVSGASMSDEFVALVEAIAAHANHVIAHADGEIIIYKNGDWTAHANPNT